MWPFHTFGVVRQPPMSNGSGDTVAEDGSTSRKKGVAISAILAAMGNVLSTKNCYWTFN